MAREIIINGVCEFINQINENESIYEYTKNNKLNHLNIEFGLVFFDDAFLMNKNNEIAYASLIDGNVFYNIKDEKMLETIHQETFEEALKIVESEKQQEITSESKSL